MGRMAWRNVGFAGGCAKVVEPVRRFGLSILANKLDIGSKNPSGLNDDFFNHRNKNTPQFSKCPN
jgi:hypothetical protein